MPDERPWLASLKLNSTVAMEFISEFLGTFLLVVCVFLNFKTFEINFDIASTST